MDLDQYRINLLRKMAEKDERIRRKTERGDLLIEFANTLNKGRREVGLKPLTVSAMGAIFQGYSLQDIYYIRSVCKDARSFNAMFWYLMKKKKSGYKT